MSQKAYTKTWCYGSDTNPNAVIKALEEQGASNVFEEDGYGNDSIYFTDADGFIRRNDAKNKIERDLLTSNPTYRQIFPPVGCSKHIVKMTKGDSVVVGVLEINKAYDGALRLMVGKSELEINAVPFDNKRKTSWISVADNTPSGHEHILCRMADGTIVSGYIGRVMGASVILVADDGVELIENQPLAWMPIPE